MSTQGDSPDEGHVDPHGQCAAEIARLKIELERAYRALHGFHWHWVQGEQPTNAMLAYHGLTLGAARRFITDKSFEGADYFIGKHVSVLQDVMKGYKT